MMIITTMEIRRNQKQMKFEQRLLRELSLPSLRSQIQVSFSQYVQHNRSYEEYCFEIAIESYLLGARYSKFGYFGESYIEVKERSYHEELSLAESLFDFIIHTSNQFDEIDYDDELYTLCLDYTSSWWKEGFERGERRYKLRLS